MRIAVVGAGVVGLSTVAALTATGSDEVTCFERGPGVLGERSAGGSRIFRLAHRDPDLVRLARASRAIFERWGDEARRPMLDRGGCVVSGAGVEDTASAMQAALAEHEIVADDDTDRLRLPVVASPGPCLVDPAGGVSDVDAVRAHLAARAAGTLVHEPVEAVEPDGSGARVRTASGEQRFDAVVVAAGAGTPELAAPLGIEVPSALVRHVRFTFADDVPDRPCWIDDPDDGVHTYQHRSGPGQWAIGATVNPELVRWDVGADAAEDASRQVVLGLVADRLTVTPGIIDRLHCTTTTPPQGDGFTVDRAGGVLVVHGANLFKLAPVIGEALAVAARDGSTPTVPELADRLD